MCNVCVTRSRSWFASPFGLNPVLSTILSLSKEAEDGRRSGPKHSPKTPLPAARKQGEYVKGETGGTTLNAQGIIWKKP